MKNLAACPIGPDPSFRLTPLGMTKGRRIAPDLNHRRPESCKNPVTKAKNICILGHVPLFGPFLSVYHALLAQPSLDVTLWEWLDQTLG